MTQPIDPKSKGKKKQSDRENWKRSEKKRKR